MKVAIIGTAGIPAQYGGFETLAENLASYLGEETELSVFCSSGNYPQKHSTYHHARLLYVPIDANSVQSIFYDFVAMLRALFFADTLLILGVSGCIALPIVRLFSRVKIIVNIDGLEWKRDKWNAFAKWFLKFSEKMAVKFSHEVITDNKAIQDYVQKEYSVLSNLITYGGDHAVQLPLTDQIRKKYLWTASEYAFSVCRIEPENNIHVILDAFFQNKAPLVIVGNWQNSEYGNNLKLKFSAYENIHMLNPIYDQHVLNQLRGNATLYVHGHSAGGTNPSLVEAMCLGLAVICYDVNYNRETTENKAIYFKDSADLQQKINDAFNGDLADLRHNMKEIALRRYTWETITREYGLLLNPAEYKK